VVGALSYCVLEIGLTGVVLALAVMLPAQVAFGRESGPAEAAALAGTALTTFPMAMYVVVFVWSVLPERRSGGYLRHPERLLVPSLWAYPLGGLLTYAVWRSG
jgi:hypothetical protein